MKEHSSATKIARGGQLLNALFQGLCRPPGGEGTTGSGWLAAAAGCAAALTALVLLVTWPWARVFTSGFVRHWDPPFHAWKLNLAAEAILGGRILPEGYNSNSSYPSSLTFYYEALHWPQSLLAAALRLMTDNTVLVYHAVLLFFWVLSGVCFFFLLRELEFPSASAFLGAAVFTIMPYRVSYLPEFNMQLTTGLVLFLFFFVRFSRKPSLPAGIGLGLSFWFQAASELYQALIIVLAFLPLAAPHLGTTLPGRLRQRSFWTGTAGALAAAVPLCLYFLGPYQTLHDYEGFARSVTEMGQHGLEPLAYLRSFRGGNLVPWIAHISHDEMSVYPTLAVLAGALLHAWFYRRAPRGGTRREPRPLAALRSFRLAAAGGLLIFLLLLDTSAGVHRFPGAGLLVNVLLLSLLGSTLALAVLVREEDRRALFLSGLAGAAAFCLVLSFGPLLRFANAEWSTPNLVFSWLAGHVSLLSGMRVVSRFSLFVLIFLVVASISGWERLSRRLSPPRRLALTALLLALVVAESRHPSLSFYPFDAPRTAASLEGLNPEESTLLVLPMGERKWDSQYMLAVAGSRRLLLYGWNGFYPPFQQELRLAFKNGDYDRLFLLLRRIWPETYLLLDRWHAARDSRKDSGGFEGSEQLQEALDREGTVIGRDERFNLYRLRPRSDPSPFHEKLVRLDLFRRRPVLFFEARPLDEQRPQTLAVAVNDTLLATSPLPPGGGRFHLEVPAEAMVDVYPNAVRIGTLEGGPLFLDRFDLASVRETVAGRNLRAEPEANPPPAPPPWISSFTRLPGEVEERPIFFRNGVTLHGVSGDHAQAEAGGRLRLTFYFSAPPGLPLAEDLVFFAHVRRGKEILFQREEPLLAGIDRASLRVQPRPKIFAREILLEVPPGCPPGPAEVSVGLARPDGKRISGRSSLAGGPRAFVLPLQCDVRPPAIAPTPGTEEGRDGPAGAVNSRAGGSRGP